MCLILTLTGATLVSLIERPSFSSAYRGLVVVSSQLAVVSSKLVVVHRSPREGWWRTVADIESVLPDLEAEGAELDQLVASLSEADWGTPTPAAGWSIAHQLAHLHWTDEAALLAITDPAEFHRQVREMFTSSATTVDDAAESGAQLPPPVLLERWRAGRDQLAAALRAVEPEATIAWFGPPMRPTSMATARLMETWAHSLDVSDGLGLRRAPTMRIKHVAHLAVRTRDFAFAVHDEPAPEFPFRIELVAPDGSVWTWGPENAETVTGSALDFCLLATQRINRADTGLRAGGSASDRWLDIIQAFAGPPGPGREPRSTRTLGSGR